jgi:hypothetical protein
MRSRERRVKPNQRRFGWPLSYSDDASRASLIAFRDSGNYLIARVGTMQRRRTTIRLAGAVKRSYPTPPKRRRPSPPPRVALRMIKGYWFEQSSNDDHRRIYTAYPTKHVGVIAWSETRILPLVNTTVDNDTR